MFFFQDFTTIPEFNFVTLCYVCDEYPKNIYEFCHIKECFSLIAVLLLRLPFFSFHFYKKVYALMDADADFDNVCIDVILHEWLSVPEYLYKMYIYA